MVASAFDQPATYEITVRGRLPQNWTDFFGDFQVAWRTHGETLFRFFWYKNRLVQTYPPGPPPCEGGGNLVSRRRRPIFALYGAPAGHVRWAPKVDFVLIVEKVGGD